MQRITVNITLTREIDSPLSLDEIRAIAFEDIEVQLEGLRQMGYIPSLVVGAETIKAD